MKAKLSIYTITLLVIIGFKKLNISEFGKRYCRLFVIEKTDKRYHSITIYKCMCDCDKEIEIDINKL